MTASSLAVEAVVLLEAVAVAVLLLAAPIYK